MSAPTSIGRVSLVGAGPGDPDLLTVRACRRLAEADLVLFDALAAQDLRPLAPEARWFYVGKRAGRASMAQDAINRLMVREARRGHQVVRLKGGDPFVFGRGGEEALALAEAGIPFEVIPGISSAVAAPGSFGIPVTHRGAAAAFCVVSGHAPSAYGPVLDALPASGVTLVVLMGYAARADIAARLLVRGFPAETPAALLVGATTPEAFSWIGRLDELAGALSDDERIGAHGAPVMIVIGAVVRLAGVLGGAASVVPRADADVDPDAVLPRRREEGGR
jgi:uroporphyrin-III C-methyltransferase/precorrin-2 dehydrogenase/sirohydrochlorin ferrochelatase